MAAVWRAVAIGRYLPRKITSNSESFYDLRELWSLLCEIQTGRGKNLPTATQAWGTTIRGSLLWEAQSCFDKLCSAGCNPISLAIVVWLLKISQSLAENWRIVFGLARRRLQIIASFTKTASLLEELHKSFGAIIFENQKNSIHNASGLLGDLAAVDPLSIGIVAPISLPELFKASPVNPATTIRVLRAYAEILRGSLTIAGGAKSPDALAKYLISAYVKNTTGEFHDSEVSALIGSVRDDDGYDATAHKMWRSRNYQSLDKRNFSLVEALIGIGVVVA